MNQLTTVLDALEYAKHDELTWEQINNAVTIVKQMMQAEPVAWMVKFDAKLGGANVTDRLLIWRKDSASQQVAEHLIRGVEPLYATPFVATPLSKGARLAVFSDAETAMRRNPELSWRDAIVDQVELAHGIGGINL